MICSATSIMLTFICGLLHIVLKISCCLNNDVQRILIRTADSEPSAETDVRARHADVIMHNTETFNENQMCHALTSVNCVLLSYETVLVTRTCQLYNQHPLAIDENVRRHSNAEQICPICMVYSPPNVKCVVHASTDEFFSSYMTRNAIYYNSIL